MSEIRSSACPEYDALSRRSFLQATAGTAAVLAATSWLPRIAVARDYRSGSRDVLVTIFLRGAADALTLVSPYNDANYAAARPTLRVGDPDNPTDVANLAANQLAIPLANATTPGGIKFGFPQALAPLLVPYNDGRLLIVHATGSTNGSRSHFDAQRYMEIGKPGDETLFTGWIGRHLSSISPPMNANGLLRAIGIGDGIQRALAGGVQTLPIPDPSNYTLSGTSSSVTARKTALMDMYGQTVDPVRAAAQTALDTISLLQGIGFSTYAPSGGAVYPNSGVGSNFGKALRSTAAMIRANIGLEAVTIDLGGWDNHTGQSPFAGTNTMYGYMDALAKGIAAFYTDLSNTPGAPTYTLMVMSEFGRRLAQNGTLGSGQEGTDHGHGAVMFVLGPAVAGGRVMTTWPGLSFGQLYQNIDLNVTTDYRHILAEIVQNRAGNTNLAAVFPGFTPQFQGVLA